MTNSRFDAPGEKRPFCVVPVRAAKDRRLKISELRVLMALGHYANRAGVCWPSMKTLGEITSIDPADVLKNVAKLVETGHVRQLNPNDYDQKKGVWGHSNRYQLLWRGDDPVPTWEQVKDANLLQPHEDRDPIEGSGAQGTVVEDEPRARVIEAAWAAGVERATGTRPSAPPPAAGIVRLLEAGVPPGAVTAETAAMVREMGRVPPFAALVDRILPLYKSHTVG
jgi:hypothetical protein